ncbi:MAG: MPT63 family protein [Mycobacteriaceae bacterium]|nr:MPT63 family protein [Mycobacteriaceae bacterium]
MKIGNGIIAVVASAGVAAAGIISVPSASATAVGKFGSWQRLTDQNGSATTIAAWAVSQPKPSNDTIPNYPLAGKLYEAIAGYKALQGGGTPIIPNLNARTSDGQNYQVLWQASTPNGISGASLQQGDSSKGKIYFDVTGAAPTQVAYFNGAQDLIIWQ